MNEWLSVEDHLPNHMQEIRFQALSGIVLNGYYDADLRKFIRGDFCSKIEIGLYTSSVVVQWLPLPTPAGARMP